MNQWISVKDELPPQYTYVLCYVQPKHEYSFNSYNNIKIKWVTKKASKGIIDEKSWFNEATHWMHLPKPPKE